MFTKIPREFNFENVIKYIFGSSTYRFQYLNEIHTHDEAVNDIEDTIKSKIMITCHQWALLYSSCHCIIDEKQRHIVMILKAEKLGKDEIPKKNDLIFYYDHNRKLKHSGVFKDNVHVMSKFGTMSVYEHTYYDICYVYGFFYEIARPTTDTKNNVQISTKFIESDEYKVKDIYDNYCTRISNIVSYFFYDEDVIQT